MSIVNVAKRAGNYSSESLFNVAKIHCKLIFRTILYRTVCLHQFKSFFSLSFAKCTRNTINIGKEIINVKQKILLSLEIYISNLTNQIVLFGCIRKHSCNKTEYEKISIIFLKIIANDLFALEPTFFLRTPKNTKMLHWFYEQAASERVYFVCYVSLMCFRVYVRSFSERAP